MNGIEKIGTEEAYLMYFYAYFAIAAIITFYIVNKSKVKFKPEIFFLSFYIMTGNINELLTIKIPGLSLFEIQPQRFLFLMFSFLLFRYFLLAKDKSLLKITWTIPWFQFMIILYVVFKIISQFTHANHIGFGKVFINSIHTVNFLVIFFALILLSSKETFKVLGKIIIITALFSTLISLIQVFVDPVFMRVGDHRGAFGDVLRANGLFSAENYNSFFLITAIAWVLVTINSKQLKLGLMAIFSFGILLTFHRMSYLILSLIVAIYYLFIEKIAIDRIVLIAMTGIFILLSTFLLFRTEIVNSPVVQERLSEDVGGRVGYYTMVFENIGYKPIFGYGGKDNEVYFYSMLQVTKEQNRATGFSGGIHSSYLSAMFYYGIPAFIFFTLMVIFSLAYFARLTTYHLFFAIPLIVSLFYAVGSITNSYLFDRYIAIIYAIHLGLGIGAKHISDYYPLQKETGIKSSNQD